MKKTEINRILKKGSVRQKTILYMTDIALVNTDLNNLQYEIKNGEVEYKGTPLLTKIQREQLWESIKMPEDIAYYNELRSYNRGFEAYKPFINETDIYIMFLKLIIRDSVRETLKLDAMAEAINDILEIIPDEKTRDKALEIAVSLGDPNGENYVSIDNVLKGTTYKEKGSPAWFELQHIQEDQLVKIHVKTLNGLLGKQKYYLNTMEKFVEQWLPLYPYKEYLKQKAENCRDALTLNKPLSIKHEDLKVFDYDKIEIDPVTEEGILSIKNAGNG